MLSKKAAEGDEEKKKSKLFSKIIVAKKKVEIFKEQNEFPRHYMQPRFLELWPCEIDFSVDWIHWQFPFLQSHTVPFPPFKEQK